jgi:hypothetical protein
MQPKKPHSNWKFSVPPPKLSVEPAFISAKVNGRASGKRPSVPLPVTGTTMESSSNCEPELLVVVMRTVTNAVWFDATLYTAGTSACAETTVKSATRAEPACTSEWRGAF